MQWVENLEHLLLMKLNILLSFILDNVLFFCLNQDKKFDGKNRIKDRKKNRGL